MGDMADRMQAAIDEANEGNTSVADAAAGPGTGNGDDGGDDHSSAGKSNADKDRRTPETVPYSRFAEVNTQLNELKAYAQLKELGIEPDSAVRLANFEAAFTQDPRGVIAHVVDSIADLPDATKTAVKTLLEREAGLSDEDGAGRGGDRGDDQTMKLPPEVQEMANFVREEKARRENADSQARLDLVVNHWKAQDEKDGLKVPDKTRLTWISATAARGEGFTTLEELAEMARKDWLEDRETTLGGAIQQRRGTEPPLRVPGRGAASNAIAPKSMAEARKLILADIEAGRLPGMNE